MRRPPAAARPANDSRASWCNSRRPESDAVPCRSILAGAAAWSRVRARPLQGNAHRAAAEKLAPLLWFYIPKASESFDYRPRLRDAEEPHPARPGERAGRGDA